MQPTGTLSGSGTVTNDVTLSGGTVNFDSSGAIGGNLNVNAGGAWNGLGSVGLVAQVNTGTLAVNGTLLSSNALVVQPTGTLSGSGTVSNDVTLNGGTVNFGSTGMIGGNLNVNAGGAWNGLGSVGAAQVNSGTLTLGAGASLTATGGVAVQGATGALAGDSTSLLTGSVNYTSSASSTFNGTVAGLGSSVTLNSAVATLALGGLNTYGGRTDIEAGILVASALADGGSASSIGQSGPDAANLLINGGTLQYAGIGESTNRQFTLGAGGGTLDASGTGTVVFSNTGAVALASTGTRLLTLTGSNTGTNTLAASIPDDANGNATSVTKSGPGTWELAGVNTYSGGTAVNNGWLKLGSDAALSTGNLTVSSPGNVDLNGHSPTISNLSGNGQVTNALDPAGPPTLGVTVPFGGSATFSGTITKTTQDLAVAKYGAGTQVFSGLNTYGGGTTINEGKIVMASTGALGTGGVTMLGTASWPPRWT